MGGELDRQERQRRVWSWYISQMLAVNRRLCHLRNKNDLPVHLLCRCFQPQMYNFLQQQQPYSPTFLKYSVRSTVYGLKSFNMITRMKMIPWPRWRAKQTGQRRIKKKDARAFTHAAPLLTHTVGSGERWVRTLQTACVSVILRVCVCAELQQHSGTMHLPSDTGLNVWPVYHSWSIVALIVREKGAVSIYTG